MTTTQIAKVASGIMMPAYSKLQSDRVALRATYLRTLSLVMGAVLPAALGIAIAAEPLIRVVYGEKWLPAVLPLQLLAAFGLFRSLAAFSGYLFEGIGKPKVSLIMGAWRLGFLLPAIVPATLYYGLAGTAVAMTAGMAVQWIVGLRYLSKELGIGLRETLAAVFQPMWTAAIMGVAVWGVVRLVPSDRAWGLLAICASGVAIYVGLNWRVLTALRKERWS
jgi:O-antigen/teichoic acid export membrane protein